MTKRGWAFVLLWWAGRAGAQEPAREVPQFGPPHGTLMIVGGGLRSEALVKRFIGLAGGADASIVLIPTADEGDDSEAYWRTLRQLEEPYEPHTVRW